MPARIRVALQGFSEFERSALTFCFRHAATRVPAYVQVDQVADSDFIVADASREPAVGSPPRVDRVRDTLFIGHKPPPDAIAHLPRPIDPERILRALDQMAAQRQAHADAGRPDVLPPLGAYDRLPVLSLADEVSFATPQALGHESELAEATGLKPHRAAAAAFAPANAQAESAPRGVDAEPRSKPHAQAAAQGSAFALDATEPAAPPSGDRLGPAERAAAKAAARQASRHARLAQSAAASEGTPRDVLVLDLTAQALALCGLLETFGFLVHRTDSIAAATTVLERTPLAAAFLDLAAEDATGVDGLDLCRRIKRRQLRLAGDVPAVMLMSDHDSASGRVNAKLAGCDALLALPITRGAAAQALESCGVALPADPRRT